MLLIYVALVALAGADFAGPSPVTDNAMCCYKAYVMNNYNYKRTYNPHIYGDCACVPAGTSYAPRDAWGTAYSIDGTQVTALDKFRDKVACEANQDDWCPYPQGACAYGKYEIKSGTCCDNPLLESSGDPHMRNILGESFDLSKEGEHMLIQLPQDDGAELEVLGTVEAFERDRKCPVYFMTKLVIRGSSVGDQPLEIAVHETHGVADLGVKLGSSTDILRVNEPVAIGNTNVKACSEAEPLCKTLSPTKRQPSNPKKLMVTLPDGISIMTSHFASAKPAFINIAVAGLHHKKEVGGLLGHEDHTTVDATPECTRKQASKGRKTSMFQTDNSELAMMAVGHAAKPAPTECFA